MLDDNLQIDMSLIVPAYNEACNLPHFMQLVHTGFSDFEGTYEVVFVDDGSQDNTLDVAKDILKQYTASCQITVVELSKNFGKESALYAGLEIAKGDYCCFIDSDLQQLPQTARQMYEKLKANPEYDCIAAYQENRKQSKIKNWLASKFYKILSKSSRMEVIDDASDFRVFNKKVAKALLNMPEYFRFSKGIFAWIGFKTMRFAYTPSNRKSGKSSFTFRSLFSYAMDGLLSFTTFPLRIATYAGLIFALAAVIYLIIELVKRLAFGVDMPGYSSLIIILLFFAALQLIVLGILGEYLGRLYIENKNRPIYIARNIIRSDGTNSED